MRVAMLVQKVDDHDWLMAFTVRWIRALAARVDHVHVITLEQREADLPPNVTVQSMGKERGYGRLRELIAFYRALGRVIRDVDVIFSHMTPRYTWLSAPYALMYSKPQMMWYAHRHVNVELRLALALCTYAVTSVPTAFPLPSEKLRVIGQGIDTAFFAPDPNCLPDDPPLIVYVARMMPIKHHESLLRALTRLDSSVRVALVGGVPDGQDSTYLSHLQKFAHDLGIAERVTFTGGLLAEAVRDWSRRATVAVNLSPPGLFDKAALESMLTGVPTIVSNAAFDDLLGEHVSWLRIAEPDDMQGLAAKLESLIALAPQERAAIGLDVRERVKTAHSLDGLMDRLVALMTTLAQKRLR
jgi:glycosyltransferase involved in cell wall biosynthesis